MPEHTSSTADSLLTLAVLGGAGWVAYQHVYLPWKVRQDVQRQADWIQRQRPGTPRGDALTQGAAMICQLIAAGKYAMPPQASAPVCGPLGILASGTLRALPEIAGYGTKAATAVALLPVNVTKNVVTEVAKPFVSAGKSVGKFFSKLF